MNSDISNGESRPDVSVYWQPGCTSCLKVKEYMEELGIPFENVNIAADRSGLEEVLAAGLRSIPAVRFGDRFVYAQNLDDVAHLLGISRNHRRLPHDVLFARWDEVLTIIRRLADKFSDEQLRERVLPIRKRSIEQLFRHIFLIVVAFRAQIDDGLVDTDTVQNSWEDMADTSKSELLAHIEATLTAFRSWRTANAARPLPERIMTYYGEQSASQVLERAVYHCTQHARQLDIVAAGRAGAELELAGRDDLFLGLPLPRRLWA
jgi:glutaredoxin